jgi:hypothetical protein
MRSPGYGFAELIAVALDAAVPDMAPCLASALCTFLYMKIPIGLVHDFPTESAAWAEVKRQHLQLNELTPRNVRKPGSALHDA